MPPELKEEMMEKLLEAIKSGKVKAVSIAFEGGEEEEGEEPEEEERE